MTPLTVVCFKWEAPTGSRASFGSDTVNVLQRMVARWYPDPHEFVCATDNPRGLDPSIRVVPLWSDYADLRSPHDDARGLRRNPACYRRLKVFAPEIAAVFGARFVCVDLDAVITGDLRPVWNRPEPFVMWGDTNPTTHYNGSMVLMTAGARRQVWDDFDPDRSPRLAQKAGQFGSDQAWISYRLGGDEAKWTRRDGVHSFRNEIRPHGGALPMGARVVFFHGKDKPWAPDVLNRYGWVREHYR